MGIVVYLHPSNRSGDGCPRFDGSYWKQLYLQISFFSSWEVTRFLKEQLFPFHTISGKLSCSQELWLCYML